MNAYYIELNLHFNSDFDVTEVERIVEIKACGFTQKKDAFLNPVTNSQTAKIHFKTKELTDPEIDIELEHFVERLADKFEKLQQVILSENGQAFIYVVFTKTDNEELPVIGLTAKTIKLLSKINVGVYVDFA